jgi:hypothetical protein
MHVKYASRHAVYPVPNAVLASGVIIPARAVTFCVFFVVRGIVVVALRPDVATDGCFALRTDVF